MIINGVEVNFNIAKISEYKAFMAAKDGFVNKISSLSGTKEKMIDELIYEEALNMFKILFGDEIANRIMRTDEGATFTAYYCSITEFFENIKKQEAEILSLKQKFELAMAKK